jgi:hypothetical protein
MKKTLLALFFAPFVLLVLLEGTSSFLLLVKRYFAPLPPIIVEYDKEIGWVGKPNISEVGVYGPGTHFQTNSMGLRMNREVTCEIPQGKIRVVCSGDSFTAGHGLSDGLDWCTQISKLSSKFETVNLGQSGYSVDQSYLLFNRLQKKIPHHIHVFAATGLDFERLLLTQYNGRGKSFLAWKEGHLTNLAFPIPKSELVTRRFAKFASSGGFNSLKILELVQKFVPRVIGSTSTAVSPEEGELESIPVATEIFKRLNKEAKDRKQKFIVVYLPTYYDYYYGRHRELRAELKSKLQSAQIPYYDFTTTFSHLPVKQIVEGGDGHYVAEVQEQVAKEVLKLF